MSTVHPYKHRGHIIAGSVAISLAFIWLSRQCPRDHDTALPAVLQTCSISGGTPFTSVNMANSITLNRFVESNAFRNALHNPEMF